MVLLLNYRSTFHLEASYAEKSCHKPEHFLNRAEVFRISWSRMTVTLLRNQRLLGFDQLLLSVS